jgi:hypothetical protein
LLDAIKAIKSAEASAPAIRFSRVRLWTDTGEDCKFVPMRHDDLKDNEDCIDFGEFHDCQSGAIEISIFGGG